MKLDYTSRWLLQKISAVIFLLALSYSIYSIYNLGLKNYDEILLWFKNYLNSFSILILFLSIFFHSNIGLNSIIDDYFHDEILKKKVLLIKNFFFAVLLFITIFSLIKLVFG